MFECYQSSDEVEYSCVAEDLRSTGIGCNENGSEEGFYFSSCITSTALQYSRYSAQCGLSCSVFPMNLLRRAPGCSFTVAQPILLIISGYFACEIVFIHTIVFIYHIILNAVFCTA